jgi:hypothetical protein
MRLKIAVSAVQFRPQAPFSTDIQKLKTRFVRRMASMLSSP